MAGHPMLFCLCCTGLFLFAVYKRNRLVGIAFKIGFCMIFLKDISAVAPVRVIGRHINLDFWDLGCMVWSDKNVRQLKFARGSQKSGRVFHMRQAK
jgi:hypothetical protein